MAALTISRKENEAFTVGEVSVRVNKIRQGRVSLTIKAPSDVRIKRSELAEKDAEQGEGTP